MQIDMNTPFANDEHLLTLLLSGVLNGMEDMEFIRQYFPAENVHVGWECFERWADARKDKFVWELAEIDPTTDDAGVAIFFAAAEQ